MLLGLGSDIIEIERIREAITRYGDRFLDKLFTLNERIYCEKFEDPGVRFAGRFSAKEAVSKALGTGFSTNLSWKDIEIVNDEYGKPIVALSERTQNAFGYPKIILSISHCRLYATATAIAFK